MTTALIIITIYIIGCVLAYGKTFAMFYEIDEDFVKYVDPRETGVDKFVLLIPLLSWVAFGVGVAIYFIEGDKYFFKWSKKDLIEKYNK